MAIALGRRRLIGRPAAIGIGIGLALWLVLVAGLAVIPLDKGDANSGIYALIGTLMPYENEDGERTVKQVYKPR